MANRKSGMPTPVQASPGTSGDLSRTRQQRGITLEQIAASTKISMRFLRAIEAEDFPQLPGGVFAVNYLRQYAQSIGADPAGLIEKYQRSMKGPALAETPGGEVGPDGRGLLDRLFRIPAGVPASRGSA